MKRKLMLFSAIAVCLSLVVGGTMAYFTTSDIARNVITTGNIGTELIENDGEGNLFEDVTGVMPGAEVDKVVTVKNSGGNPCWVRVSVDKKIELAEGREGTPDLSLVALDLNEDDWTEQDGFYYYNAVLEAGETTVPLFTAVAFDTDMDNLYQNSTASIIVNSQAVQSANNGGSALEAAGWPAE